MKIILPPELKSRKGIPFTNKHLRYLEKAGRFPKRVRLVEGGVAYGYLEDEVDAWVEARAAERNRSEPEAA
jgi:prophage regulatory protein